MAKLNKQSLLYSLLMLTILPQIKCEVYTALADLEELLQTESFLINTLENYIRAEEQKIDLLKR